MPASDIASLFGTVFKKAEEKAGEEQKKFEDSKSADIQMYQKVLFDPDTSEEQRNKAADQISKLRNLKGKDGPYHGIAGLLNTIKKHKDQKAGPGQQPGPRSEHPPSGGPGTSGPSNSGGPGIGRKILNTVVQPYGHPPSLPRIDASVFPSAAQTRTNKSADINSEGEAKWPFEERRIKLQEELRTKTAAAKARNAMSAKEKYPGEAMINALPADQRQGLLDANGIPVDPNGLYGPATGETVGIAKDDEGHTYLSGVRVGTGPAREGTSQQYVYDPIKNEFRLVPIRRTTGAPEPPKSGESGKHPSSLPPLKGDKASSAGRTTELKTGASAGKSSTSTGKKSGGVIPTRVFPVLQKQSNAINEARNSLIGDTPGEVGGMAQDIEIFKSPESVKRVGEYIKFVNTQLEESGRMATSMGAVAAAEWYIGLPSAVSNLQQEATAQYSRALDGGEQDGPEHKFVADYYRLLGTWGGMRAATGASAARWSFRNLISEIPTPGTVTRYPEAQRRIQNMANESNVVAKHNPMVEKIDTEAIYGKKDAKIEDEQTGTTKGNRKVVHRKGKWYYKDTGQEYVEPK